MQAVIRLGSHQYSVTEGDKIDVQKLNGAVGSEVRIKDVLMIADKDTVTAGSEVKGSVTGRILSQDRGIKLNVFKKRRRKGFWKNIGHRQAYTKLEILKIEAK